MSEDFKIVAPRARLAEQYGAPIGVFLFDGSAESLVKQLAIPVKPAPIWIPPAHGVYHPQHHRQAPLTDLPTELHCIIVNHIKAIEDVLSVGLASPRFRGIARERLQEYFRLLFGRWANKEIVCVGEDVEPGDYPPGLFSDEEWVAISQQECQVYNEDTDGPITITPSRLYDFARNGVSDIQREPYLRGEIFWLRNHLTSHGWCTSADLIDLGLRPRSDREFFPTDEQWILRNITRKQFVRAEAIALKPEFIHGPFINVLGFGQVLLSRICWSAPPPFGIKDPTNICRGVWAGHRFDITTLARHQRETGGQDEWIDVSNEVAEEVAIIWRSNLGADWREFLCAFG